VIVIGGAGAREGLTEDYLTVAVPEELPRGHRFVADLATIEGSQLGATPR
jgi:hypothetical protein